MLHPTVFPVQIRTDLTVYIQGLPWDLTPKEARRIARIIKAFENETPLPPSRQLPPPHWFNPKEGRCGLMYQAHQRLGGRE